MRVCDNSNGTIDESKDRMGVQLVDRLAHQIRGAMQIESNAGGTIVTIRFPSHRASR